MAESAAFLAMEKISKRFVGVQALDGVDFHLNRGEIHCLAGENGSGKSTLVKIICGVEHPEPGGRILVEGMEIPGYRSIDAVHRGITVIFQDLSLFPNLSVAENIALSQTIASPGAFVSWREIRRVAAEALRRIRIDIPLDSRVADLPLADQQLVAICRALTREVRLLIMDEPTTALTRREVDTLFEVVRDLQSRGIAVLFISHKLDEVLRIAERVTILRDGRKVGTYPVGEVTERRLSELMTGSSVEEAAGRRGEPSRQALLQVRALSRAGEFRDVSFTLHRGEVLGITGLLGSGRTELALTLFGINKPGAGEILIEGEKARTGSVQAAMEAGIGYVPEDRMTEGLILPQSVGNNIVLTVIGRLVSALGLVDRRRSRRTMERWTQELEVKAPSVDTPVQSLSGGNQQRVVLAKWLATRPRILILNGPTVGIDVAAKQSVHQLIHRLAREGLGIILISDEAAEVLYNCHHILIMSRGRITDRFDGGAASEEELRRAITNGKGG